MFKFEGEEGNVTLYTHNILGKRVDLYAINTREEAQEVCNRLNASVSELLAE